MSSPLFPEQFKFILFYKNIYVLKNETREWEKHSIIVVIFDEKHIILLATWKYEQTIYDDEKIERLDKM